MNIKKGKYDLKLSYSKGENE